MSRQHRIGTLIVPAAMAAGLLVSTAAPAGATIHPIVQSVACAAAEAWEHSTPGDPPGQTPDGFAGEIISVEFPFVIIAFPEPLSFKQSDFRALIATGFIDEVVRNADGEVTTLIVDLRNVPNAANGRGGEHCHNA